MLILGKNLRAGDTVHVYCGAKLIKAIKGFGEIPPIKHLADKIMVCTDGFEMSIFNEDLYEVTRVRVKK